MPYFKKLLPVLISAAIFSLVIWQVQPPKTFTTVTSAQIALFFLPLFLFLLTIFNLIFNFYLRSFVITLGVVLLFILKALDILNIITAGVLILAIILIVKSLKRPQKTFYQSKIPKLLKLSKQK